MPLSDFPLLQDNTRLLRHKDTLYKVKVKYEKVFEERVAAAISRKKAHAQIENAFRAILYLIQREETLDLKPILTEDFLISIVTTPWTFCQRYGFLQNGKELKAYPLQFEFRINFQHNNKRESTHRGVNTSVTESVKQSAYQTNTDNTVPDKDSATFLKFTRNSGGSLLCDGRKVVPVPDKKKQDKKNTHSPRISEREISSGFRTVSETDEMLSVDRKEILKRKFNKSDSKLLSEQVSLKRGKLKSEDKGLEVERFHNRNNSSLDTPSTEYSGYRLRERKLRKSPNSDLAARHSERLKAKRKDPLTDQSESEEEHERSKRKKLANIKSSESPDENLDDNGLENSVREAKIASKPRKLKDTEERHKTEYLHNSARKRKRKNDFTDDMNEKSQTESSDEGKHNKRMQENDRPRKTDISETKEDRSKRLKEKDNDASSLQNTKTKKHKLYTDNQCPLLIANQKQSDAGPPVTSPRISTVLPQKRTRSQADLQSPRTTRQRPLVRSPVAHTDLIASSHPANIHHRQDEESQRIQRMRRGIPTQTYRDILLAQTRDRHIVEQAERAETDKLRQLYEPTAARRSPRLQEKMKESSLWQKIIGSFLTPVKKIMAGK